MIDDRNEVGFPAERSGGGRSDGLRRKSLAIGIGELSMFFAALVMMVLAQAPAGSATLSGRVVDAQGRPAAGIEVLLSGIRRATLVRAKSDRDGRFRIEVPAEKDPERAFFPVALWAYAPGRGPSGRCSGRRCCRRRGRCN